ncbi:MAG: EAL domain-containing protein [Hyphomicrobium sp.]
MTKQDNSKPQAGVAPNDTGTPTPALGPAAANGPAVSPVVQDQEKPSESKSRDGLVVASILIVSVATSVMCYAQFGLALPISGVAGVVILALLMLIHTQMQKSAQIAQLQAELAQSRQVAKLKPASRVIPAAAPSSAASTEARIRELSRDIGNLVPLSDPTPSGAPGTAGPASTDLAADRPGRKSTRVPPQPVAEATTKSPGEVFSAALSAAAETPTQQLVPQSPAAEPVREQWSFRPRSDAQASVQDAATAMNSNPGASRVATTVEGDLELVQRKIRELADEVNAAEALRPRPARPIAPAKPGSNALEDSIGALRAAAQSMRQRPSLGDFIPKLETQVYSSPAVASAEAAKSERPNDGLGELVIPATAERIAGSDPGTPLPNLGARDVAPPSLELPLPDFGPVLAPTLPPRAAAIARAVEDDAMKILLGPIVTLAEHAVGHYEMTTNLGTLAGEALDADEDDFAVIGGELDTQFDIARLNRAAALAIRMDARDREGSLLAEFFGASMTSRAFLESFAHLYEARQRISEQLVLTFSQRAVDGFSPSAWQAVRDMHAFGFRFAIGKVRHMGTDFAALQRSGFRFVRIDAPVLLEGLTTPERFVPTEEILQRATLAGLSIIADGIRDAGTQKRLLEAGVLLGQGPLFGAPRQVNIDTGAGPPDQSAAA